MVCEKNEGTVHDFKTDPIRLVRDGDWLKADGTTLGADNGVGAATPLAVMESGDVAHGPLEFVFTVDEESGLTGAAQFPERCSAPNTCSTSIRGGEHALHRLRGRHEYGGQAPVRAGQAQANAAGALSSPAFRAAIRASTFTRAAATPFACWAARLRLLLAAAGGSRVRHRRQQAQCHPARSLGRNRAGRRA